MTSMVNTLRAAFRGQFELGCAVGGTLPEALSPREREVLLDHFDVFTPENCMKSGLIHPERGRLDTAQPDAFVRFAEQHGRRVVGHCLCWHNQAPPWLFPSGIE